MIGEIAAGGVDAVTFTSAPAVASMLLRASEIGVSDALLAALRGPVISYCVGPVTAAPLLAAGVDPVVPERMRLGALARLVSEDLPARRPELRVAGHRVGIRAAAVVVDCETSYIRLGLAQQLAGQLGAPAVQLEQLRADNLARVVRAGQAAA